MTFAVYTIDGYEIVPTSALFKHQEVEKAGVIGRVLPVRRRKSQTSLVSNDGVEKANRAYDNATAVPQHPSAMLLATQVMSSPILPKDREVIALVRKIHKAQCAACHGVNLEGQPKLARVQAQWSTARASA